MKILLIEDNNECRKAMQEYLERKGNSVTSCLDGEEACQALFKEDFDLIVSDINMPNVNGYEVAEFRKKMKIDSPIVFWSSEVDVKWNFISAFGVSGIYDKTDFDGVVDFINLKKGEKNGHIEICKAFTEKG